MPCRDIHSDPDSDKHYPEEVKIAFLMGSREGLLNFDFGRHRPMSLESEVEPIVTPIFAERQDPFLYHYHKFSEKYVINSTYFTCF